MQQYDDAEPNSIEEMEAMNYNPCLSDQRFYTQEKLDEAVKESIGKLKNTLIILSSQ